MAYSTDPRAARSREAMLDAARGILVGEGPGAVTHQRVAHEAGVGRATVYRHWPRVDQLLLDVMSGADLPHFKEPESPIRAWLRRELRNMADELEVPSVAGLSLTLMQSAIWEPEAARRRDESIATITERLHAAVEKAVASGELETDTHPEDVTSLLIGPIVYRATMQQAPVPDELIDRLVTGIGTWR